MPLSARTLILRHANVFCSLELSRSVTGQIVQKVRADKPAFTVKMVGDEQPSISVQYYVDKHPHAYEGMEEFYFLNPVRRLSSATVVASLGKPARMLPILIRSARGPLPVRGGLCSRPAAARSLRAERGSRPRLFAQKLWLLAHGLLLLPFVRICSTLCHSCELLVACASRPAQPHAHHVQFGRMVAQLLG